ncbi:hypothetical protein LOTGIDRAFT_123455, partial [Lottia gigantea]
FIDYYFVLQIITLFYKSLLYIIDYYLIITSFIDYYFVLQIITLFYRLLLCFINHYFIL